jgi:hypothetical protein
LKLGHLLIGFFESLKTDSIFADSCRKETLLDLHHFDVKLEQLEIRSGSDIILPPQLSVEVLGVLSNRVVDINAHVRQLFSELIDTDGLVGLELSSGHRLQSLIGPFLKPVDGTAVDDRGELPASVS